MSKYILQTGGSDPTGSQMFNNYVNEILGSLRQEYSQPQEEATEETEQSYTEPESEFIQGLYDYEEKQSKLEHERLFQSKLDKLQQLIDERLNAYEQKEQEFDWFASEEGEEYLGNIYNTQANSAPASETDPPKSSPFAGIFRNENARTGEVTKVRGPGVKNPTATGRGQMVRGTRLLMYKKLGITDIQQAETMFKTDSNFELKVLNAYREDLDAKIPKHITGKQREYMIAKGWYTGDVNYPDNVIPRPDAGNTLTAGEYAKRAVGIK